MPAAQKSILLIIPWFGRWPEWMRFFLASCAANPTVDWALVSDCPPRADFPPNVRLVSTTFEEYRAFVSRQLGIACRWNDPYKVCDVRPAFGVIHADLVANYDYWGYGDIDVIYGDIRALLTPDVLEHDLISSHAHVVAGHFTLYRTSETMNHAFRRIFGWRRLLSDPRHRSFDEQKFSQLFPEIKPRQWIDRLRRPLRANALFREQFSTAIPPLLWIDGTRNHPEEWYWRKGKLTTNRSGDREFLYLHFSNWQSNRWTSDAEAPWKRLDRLDNLPGEAANGFMISRAGFTALPEHLMRAVETTSTAKNGQRR